MTIYKTVLKILNENRVNLLIGIMVTAFITFFYVQNTQSGEDMLSGTSIAILDKDDSEASQALTSFLNEEQEIITLTDKSQRGIDDALFFNQVSYVLTIPADFQEQLAEGGKPLLDVQARPDSFSKVLVNNQINDFLNKFIVFQTIYQDIEKSLLATKRTVGIAGEVTIKDGVTERNNQSVRAMMFNSLAYGLFLSIFSGFGIVNLVFNEKKILNRNRCSPVSQRKFARKIFIGLFGYASVLLVAFTLFLLFVTKSEPNQRTIFHLINIGCFFITILAFSSCVTSMVKNSEALSGISNVFIMGTCFIGGVFVPTAFLPEVITKIAAFTPTYWFVQSNLLIGDSQKFDAAFLSEFQFNCLILLAFAAVFVLFQILIKKEKRQLRMSKNQG